MSTDLAAEVARLARQLLGALQQPLRLTHHSLALLEPLLQTQEGAGIFEQSTSTLTAGRQPA